MRRRYIDKAIEYIKREAGVALPAAIRAVKHGAQAAARRFPEEYARERKKR